MKQVDDNYTYLYVDLSDFLNYEYLLLDSVAHFITFNLKAVSVTRQLKPRHFVFH